MKSTTHTSEGQEQSTSYQQLYKKINDARAQYPELSRLPVAAAHPNYIRRLIEQHLPTVQDSSAKESVLQIAQELKGERTWFDDLIDVQQQELSTTLTADEVIENPYASMDRKQIARMIADQGSTFTIEQMALAVAALVLQAQDPEMPLTAYYLILDYKDEKYSLTPDQIDTLVTIFETNESDPKNYNPIGYLILDCHKKLTAEQLDRLVNKLETIITTKNAQQISHFLIDQQDHGILTQEQQDRLSKKVEKVV